ncbi:MAG: hypothetical protein JO141_02265 [Bradyrhizobium sp.]|nr:hypothetical protein [Bradyrhizobium sp.]
MGIQLRVEVKIHFAQPVQFFEILIVKDSGEPTGPIPEAGLPRRVETTVGNQPANQVRLPQPDDAVKLLRRGCIAHQSYRFVHGKPACTKITTKGFSRAKASPEIRNCRPDGWKGLSRKHDFISVSAAGLARLHLWFVFAELHSAVHHFAKAPFSDGCAGLSQYWAG